MVLRFIHPADFRHLTLETQKQENQTTGGYSAGYRILITCVRKENSRFTYTDRSNVIVSEEEFFSNTRRRLLMKMIYS